MKTIPSSLLVLAGLLTLAKSTPLPQQQPGPGPAPSPGQAPGPGPGSAPAPGPGPAPGPAPGKCATKCSGASSKFQYEVGKSYNFKYETDTKVKLAGVSQNEAGVKIDAVVQISVIAPCEFSIKLGQVKVTGPSAADLGSDWIQILQSHVTRFSFDDGRIGEICPQDAEPSWSVNIKRAILSALQNDQTGRTDTIETYEEDVSGRCPTKFELKQEGDAKIITKTKNLVGCFNRYGLISAIRFVTYEVRSAIQGTPGIDSKQTCKQTIRGRRLTDVVCEEKHILKRFSNADKGGFIATATQKLQFQGEAGAVEKGESGQPEKLYFDHKEMELVDSKQAIQDARQNLKDLCKTNEDGVRPETPGLFNELVYNLRKISPEALKTLYQESAQAGGCEHARDCFLNALPMCGLSSCVSLMADILKTEYSRLTYMQTRVYFTSLALLPHVTKEMVVGVTPLIDTVPKEGLLGISSLVHTYCRENPSCGTQPEVAAIVTKLTALLGTKCESSASGEGRDAVLYVLKALGNIGHSSEGVDKRVNCLKENANAVEVRLAAIHSLRRTPCSDRVAPLMERFADVNEDIEIRLSSFLTLITCATPKIVNEVKEILEKEQIHQVGSFVRTYFEQVGSSSDPCKQEIQNLLSSHQISKRFNSDAKKYSRFFETSQFSSKWNFGGHAEHGLIFTPDGYLPRQGFLNLTLDAFGSSINLLEIGGRVEGLETLLDKLFGPHGYFTNPTGFYFKPDTKTHKNPRVAELQAKYGAGIKKHPNLDLSMYARIFGDEIAYKSVRGLDVMGSYQQMMQKIMASLQAGQEANVNLVRANQLINHYVSIPTISGLPLHLGVNGTVAINVDFKGKVDLSALMKTRSGEIRASLKPSAVGEMAYIFAIHVGQSKHGVRIQERLHTSTAANVLVELRKGEMFKWSLELPKQKNEILQYDIKLFTIKSNVPLEEPGIMKDRVSGEICTPERFNKWIGFKVCHEVAFANATSVPDAPYFPLTGPVRYAITLEKVEPVLKSYDFTATWKNAPGSRTAKFSFTTPGSSVDREVTLDYDYQRGKSLTVNFKSPLKKINAVGTLEAAADKQTGRIQIKVDDSKEYTLIGTQERKVTSTGHHATYKGEIIRPGLKPITITAVDTLEAPPTGLMKGNFELNAVNLYDTPVEFKWAVERTAPRQGTSTIILQCPRLNAKIAGKFVLDGSTGPLGVFRLQHGTSKIQSDWNIEYHRPGANAEPHKVEAKYGLDYSRDPSSFKLIESLSMKSSRYQQYNFDYKLSLEKTPQKLDIQAHGKEGTGMECMLAIASSINPSDNKATGTATLKSARLGFDHKADFTYQNNWPRQFAASAKLDTPQTKGINGEVKLTTGRDTEGEAKLSYPGRELRLYKKLQMLGENKHKSQMVVQWQKDSKIQLDNDVTFDRRTNDYELKTVANGIGGQQWTFHKKVKIDQGSSVKSSALLQAGSQVIYDWKLDLINEGPRKHKIQAQLRSDYGGRKIDVAADGSVEEIDAVQKVNFISKKDQKDFVKGELIIPTLRCLDRQCQLKVDLSWEKNSFLLDHKVTWPSRNQLQLDSAFKLDLPESRPSLDYKLTVILSADQTKGVNISLLKADKQVLDADISYYNILADQPNPNWLFVGYDAAVKISEPWPKRHLSTFGKVKFEGRAAEVAMQAENVEEKRKYGLRYARTDTKPFSTVFELESYFNDRYIKSKNTYEWKFEEARNVLNGEIEYHEGTRPGKITYETTYIRKPDRMVTVKLHTPFSQFSDFYGTVEYGAGKPTGRKFIINLNWNENQNISLHTSADLGEPGGRDGLVDIRYLSTVGGLKSAELLFRSDFADKFEANVTWNEVNSIGAHHRHTGHLAVDQTWSSGFEATIPNTANYKSLMKADWNVNTGKYNVLSESQINAAGIYKMEAAFDTKSSEGTVDITTPGEQLKNLKAQVKKAGDSEYELKVVQNEQTVADVKATFQLGQNKKKLAVEVKNIKKPFKTQFEHEWAQNHLLLGGEFGYDPQDLKKAYGLKLVLDHPDQRGCDVQAQLSYPARTLRLHYKRADRLPNTYEVSLEAQANAGQPGTKFRTLYEQPGAGQHRLGIFISKEKLADVHWQGNVQVQGCGLQPSPGCRVAGDVQLKYSPDPNKAVSHKFVLNREVVDQRLKYSYEWLSQHSATGIQLKHYGSALITPCPNGKVDCKRLVEAGIELLDKQKQNKVYKYKYETDSFRTAVAEITCPSGKLARHWQWNGELLQVVLKRDDKDLYEVVGGYDRRDGQVKVEVKDLVSSEVIVHAGGRKMSADAVEAELWHVQGKQKVEDISVIIALKENSRIRSRLFVRPGLKDDLGPYLKSQWEGAVAAIQGGTATGESPFVHLLQAREALKNDIVATLTPLFDHWQQQQDAIGRELGIDVSALRNLVSHGFIALRDTIFTIQNYVVNLLTQLTSSAPSQAVQKMMHEFQEQASGVTNEISQAFQSAGASIKPLMDQLNTLAENWRKIFEDLYKDLRVDQLRDYLKGIYNDLASNEFVRKFGQFLQQLGISLPDLSWERVQGVLADVQNQVSQTTGEAGQQIGQQAAYWWEELLKNEDTKVIAKFLQEAYNRLVWHLSRMGPSEKAQGVFQWITKEFRDFTSGAFVKRYLPSVQESKPEKGLYVVEATIPGEFKSLDEIASKFEMHRLRQFSSSIGDRFGTMARDADYAVRDAFLYVHPASMGVKFSSPLASTALLSGDQHIITFDDEAYDFAGECDYLLARDFDNGEFTIFVSFERRQNRVARKSVTVEYLEHKVEISYDNKVKINDKDGEMPWQILNDETNDVTLLVIRHDNIVTVKAIDGLLVECDSHYHMCTITVPRRYHGKSGGLLGTNDFEPYNEFTKPDRQRDNARNVAGFAREWHTNQGCRISDNQAIVAGGPPGSPAHECTTFFNASSSPLRLCFHRLSPNPFFNMCLSGLQLQQQQGHQPGQQPKQPACDAVAAYIEACEEHGVGLDLPSHCIQCEVGGAILSEGDTKRLENAGNNADVVFIVEERGCMNWTKTQLPLMAQRIDSDLKQQRYDVRFGLIGFNGEGVHYEPHFHTGQGELSLTVDGLRFAAAQLAFSSRERRRFQDPLTAVKFAADHFTFRPGTRKLLSIFACEECGGTEVGYLDLQSELLQMAVSLQLFTSQKIELSNPGAPEIIALDATTMYAADLSEKPELRSQLVEPHDSCTVLTQETNGTVFSYSEKNVQPLVHLLSRKMVSAVNAPKCQICECQEHERIPRVVCFPCEIPRPASLTSDSTGFFNNPFVRLQKWQKKAQDTINRGLTPTYRFKF